MSGPDPSPVEWDADGAPRSRRFGDIYFSKTDGLAESRAVFLQGCGLPGGWAGRDSFTVAELGFGTGLNILALLDLWRRSRPAGGRLQIFSVEAFPLAAEEARRALSAWPELSDLSALLTARWPRRAHGFHRIDLPELDAVFDIAVMEAGEALEAWDGRADAWFLDGFAPAANPQMWREEVLALVAARSAAGARAATFTVAGAVRRGLAAQGFEVARRPGFGRKRERLEARLGAPVAAAPRPAQRTCIVGAGIAGAALARAFEAAGAEVMIWDADGPAAGASGNPAALVTPRLDAGGGAAARLYAQAFHRAVDLFGRAPDAVIARGALQLESAERDGRRFDRLAESPLFEPGALERLDGEAAAGRLGEPCACGGLWLSEALVVEPRLLLSDWTGEVLQRRIGRIEPSERGWRLYEVGGLLLAECDQLCLAAGPWTGALAPGIELQPVRGQVSLVETQDAPTAAAWGGYVAPCRAGLIFGATHDRDEVDVTVREADHLRNLEALARARPILAAALHGRPLHGRASIRAAVRDRLPIAGEIAPGLHVLAGLGGRGFCLAPLLAEFVAARALGFASPLPRDLAAAVNPFRRALVKGP